MSKQGGREKEIQEDELNCPLPRPSDSRSLLAILLPVRTSSEFMHPRHNTIEIFSTFLQLAEDNFRCWMVDPKLRRSMERLSEKVSGSKAGENFWVLYWYKIWQDCSDRLAQAHLSAYLQEVCYWSASKTALRFSIAQYKLSDCFQMAIAAVPKVLKGYNPSQNSRLKDYASAVFNSAIRDTLRRRREIDICTDWALLRRLSQKRLVESLENAGLTPENISRYQLAWNCFKTLYVPSQATGTRQLSRPDRETWDAIAQQYVRDRRPSLSSSEPPASPETLERWLKDCAQAARSYLYPAVSSLNVPTSGGTTRELQDYLPATDDESLVAQLIDQENSQVRKSQQAQIDGVLNDAIAKLSSEAREFLHLYYREGLTQQKIAARFEMKQYKVSRRLNRARESLLKALAQWSQQTLNISLNSTAIQGASTVLEEWLQQHYSSQSNA